MLEDRGTLRSIKMAELGPYLQDPLLLNARIHGPFRLAIASDDVEALHFSIADDLTATCDGWLPLSAQTVLWMPRAAWSKYIQQPPPPGYHNLTAMLAVAAGVELGGSEQRRVHALPLFAAILRRVRACLRQEDVMDPRLSALVPQMPPNNIRGRYLDIGTSQGLHRIYVEEAGTGRSLLLLHTAGSDSRQWHHLMCAPELTESYRCVAFDMPWHGKSMSGSDQPPGAYSLDREFYCEVVLAVSHALCSDSPLVAGSSMAGQICLYLAYAHPDKFAGVIACQAAARVPNRRPPWSRHVDIDESVWVPEWIDGLVGPNTLEQHRREIWWQYSQSGHGVFAGDLDFYSGNWDGTSLLADIDTDRCPVIMLSGEYDYSCRPEMAAATAAAIPGAKLYILPGIGHFPMSEDPERFLQSFLPALQQIELDKTANEARGNLQ